MRYTILTVQVLAEGLRPAPAGDALAGVAFVAVTCWPPAAATVGLRRLPCHVTGQEFHPVTTVSGRLGRGWVPDE